MPRMGDLAATDVYSAFDVPLDQGTNVGWANRMGEILTARPQYDESTIYQTASPLVNISEGDIGRATEAAMGVSGGGMMVKPTVPNLGEFSAMAGRGQIRQARGAKDDLKAILSKEMPATDFDISGMGHPLGQMYESGALTGKLEKAGLHVEDNRMGRLFVGTSPETLQAIKSAKNPAEYGKAYGYTPDDIARFYLERRRGDAALAYQEFVKDFGGPTPKGIRAYHSSPHDFDKFDLAKIGSGEGAQVYGHGLYFAESPAVSGQGGQYWKAFADRFKNNDAEQLATMALKNSGVDRGRALKWLNEGNWKENYPKQWEDAVALLKSDKPIGPRTYEVNINADPAHMLDWDTKIGQQTPAVRDYFRKQIEQFGPEASMEAQYKIARSRAKGGGVELSAGMNEAGIPGIKYLDQGSRNAPISSMGIKQLEGRLEQYKADLAGGFGDPERMKYNIASIERELASYKPTHNYVVFDPGIIDIMKKYGIAGAAPVGMGALAAQDTYRE